MSLEKSCYKLEIEWAERKLPLIEKGLQSWDDAMCGRYGSTGNSNSLGVRGNSK